MDIAIFGVLLVTCFYLYRHFHAKRQTIVKATPIVKKNVAEKMIKDETEKKVN